MKTIPIFAIARSALPLLLSTLNPQPSTVFAQPSVITYQGLLEDGRIPATGTYDLTFTFYSFPSNGVPLAGPITNAAVPVVNGLFTTSINLSNVNLAIFNSGINAARFLEIAARTNGSPSGFSVLVPRQVLGQTPYAISAANGASGGVTSLAGGGGVTVSAPTGAVTLGSTATSANEANAIVSRDASGSFSAGSITLDGTLLFAASDPVILYSSGLAITAYGGNVLFGPPPGAGNLTMSGLNNTAIGFGALVNNTSGWENIALGYDALRLNTSGDNNVAIGSAGLQSNTNGEFNTAIGPGALSSNTSGSGNTALGPDTLLDNISGGSNTAVGEQALASNTTGSDNIAVGWGAGANITSGNFNIEIGNQGTSSDGNTIRIGTQDTQTSTFIAGIYNTPVAGTPVGVTSSGQLGALPSSARFKQDIQPMARSSDVLYALKPVTFKYKPGIDAESTPQFGLLAEDVQKADPALVTRDAEGKPYTVRYQAVDAMLLNEFLKEHQKVQAQSRRLEELTQQNAALAKQLDELQATVRSLATKQATVGPDY